jgi:hypothetical protein
MKMKTVGTHFGLKMADDPFGLSSCRSCTAIHHIAYWISSSIENLGGRQLGLLKTNKKRNNSPTPVFICHDYKELTDFVKNFFSRFGPCS